MEIRCSRRVSDRTLTQIIEPVEILSFPNGELDYSIYRGADGSTEDIYFQGLNLEEIKTDAYGIRNTLEPNNLDLNDSARNFSVYTQKETQLSTIAQTAYNSPSYARCVKTQYLKQRCPKNTTIAQYLSIPVLSAFVKKYISAANFSNLTSSNFEMMRDRIIAQKISPGRAILIDPFLSLVPFDSSLELKINAAFYAEVLTVTQIDNYYSCLTFLQTDTIPPGQTINLNLDGCKNTGSSLDFSEPENLMSNLNTFLGGSNYSFDYSKSQLDTNSGVLFRSNSYDAASINAQEFLEGSKLAGDVRAVAIDEYNATFTEDRD